MLHIALLYTKHYCVTSSLIMLSSTAAFHQLMKYKKIACLPEDIGFLSQEKGRSKVWPLIQSLDTCWGLLETGLPHIPWLWWLQHQCGCTAHQQPGLKSLFLLHQNEKFMWCKEVKIWLEHWQQLPIRLISCFILDAASQALEEFAEGT